MNVQELKYELKAKSIELERAIEEGQPHKELLVLYKELKRLQYELMQSEVRMALTHEV
jgi:hypothetical protein